MCNVCTKRTHEVGFFKCLSCDAFNDSPRIQLVNVKFICYALCHNVNCNINFCRYKLEIQVTDGKKVANFMLWDQDCMNLIGVSAANLRKKMIKVEEMQSVLELNLFYKKHFCKQLSNNLFCCTWFILAW